MNKRIISLMAAALALLSASGQVTFTGYGDYDPIEITLSNNHTSLNKIYVVFDTQGVGMSFNSTTGEPAKWETYDYHNSAVFEPVTGVRWNGMATTLDKIIPNVGYIITEGGTPFYCWVVNYADYYLELNDMFINDDKPCSLLTFNIDGHGDAITYYEVDGTPNVLDRDIRLTYETKVWNDSVWEDSTVVESFDRIDGGIVIEPPLCNTSFTLTGDQFLRQWSPDLVEGILYDKDRYETKAVNCGATAHIIDSQGKETKLDGELTGGSAPVRIVFTGHPTPAVVYREWEIATDADFQDVILQYNQDEVDYTFYDAGTYYVRYTVANAAGTCENTSTTFTINVSVSSLGSGARGDLPNVFSPGNHDKVNDVWKVTYKSLVEFHCWIYNRWGQLLYEYTDPDGGWDGTYRGKLVDTGVYYYVITALGSDGVKYKKRGDINILNYKGTSTEGEGSGY